ncbi:MAG: hypothetical protein HC763_08790 [Hydrococcus sp. CRU_1_1]|nr:hypothetical protein [Hydrococcus sp. CRU_1_1]
MTNQMLENAEKIRENLRFIADYTYTILLKIVLINSSQNLAITEKMQELCSFVENQFDLLLGREHAIAAYYFSKQLPSKFIPFKVKDISFEEVCRRLDSTARDFCLLRLPETLLFAGNEQATRLGFPCSAENAIRKIGRLITIKNAISLSDNYLPTEIEIDIETLQQELGEEVIETLQNQQQRLNNIRLQAQVEQKRIPISHEQLQELIAELEKQVQPFCKE